MSKKIKSLFFTASIEKKLVLMFFINITVISLLAIKTYQNNQRHDETAWWVDHTQQVIHEAREVSVDIKDLIAQERGYIVTGDISFITSSIADIQNIFSRIDILKTLTADNELQRVRIDSLKILVTHNIRSIQSIVSLQQAGRSSAAKNKIQEAEKINLNKSIKNLIATIQQEEMQLLEKRKQSNVESERVFSRFYFTLLACLFSTLIIAFFFLRKNLRARLLSEKELQKNKDLLQAIIDNTSSVIFVKDLKGQYVVVNKQFERDNNLSMLDVVGKTNAEFFSPSLARTFQKYEQQVLSEQKRMEYEEEVYLNEQKYNFYTVKFPLKNSQGEVWALGGVCTNITEVVQKRELEKQKEIAHTTLEAQEKERAFIAQELHDNINQLLTTAKLMQETAKTNEDVKEFCLQKSEIALAQASREIRNLSHALMPPSFDKGEFLEFITSIADSVSAGGQTKVHLFFEAEEQLDQLVSDTKLALYRIIQEQMTNIQKYARAHNVTIALRCADEQIKLTIEDDGVGFDINKKSKGIGLRNIASRVQIFSGTMNLTSGEGKGCKLEVALPQLH